MKSLSYFFLSFLRDTVVRQHKKYCRKILIFSHSSDIIMGVFGHNTIEQRLRTLSVCSRLTEKNQQNRIESIETVKTFKTSIMLSNGTIPMKNKHIFFRTLRFLSVSGLSTSLCVGSCLDYFSEFLSCSKTTNSNKNIKESRLCRNVLEQ